MKYLFRKIQLLTLVVALIFVTSCGEDVDPTQGDARIVMKASTELGTINSGARVAESNIEFTAAMLGVTKLELKSKSSLINDSDDDDDSDDGSNDDGNDDDDDDYEYEVELKGRYEVDLLNGTSNPEFGISNLFPGNYTEIELDLKPILDDDKSIFVALTYHPTSGDPIDVEISSSLDLELEIENSNGIQVDGGTLNQILILFDLDKFIAGVDFTKTEVDDDGVVRINESSNAYLTDDLFDDLDDACEMGEDDDRDDKFDDDDDDDDDDNDDDN